MKKTRKTAFCLVCFAIILCLLCACKAKNNNDADNGTGNSENNNSGETGNNQTENVIFSKDVSVTLVYPLGEKVELGGVIQKIFDMTESHAAAYGDDFAKTTAEIVFGDTNREISRKAKEKLAARLEKAKDNWEEEEKSTKYLSGFLFYAEGDSLAVVWDDSLLDFLAVECLIDNFINASELRLKNGYTYFVDVDKVEALAEKERREREVLYADVREEYGAEVESAIRAHLSMFGVRYYLWLADLYDPGEYDSEGNPLGGGFYFSNSGRDTPGFGIDLESTAQVLAFLQNSGMINKESEYREYFPEKMQKEMIAFALACQSPIDGYFYHPQWGTDVKDSRIARDCGWAVSILKYFGEIPYWNTPAGAEGQYGDPPGVEPASALSERLGGSSVSAVSKVLATAGTKKWNGSAQLATLDAWDAYLENLFKDIRTKSYSIGNTVSSQSSQILNRDKIAKANGEKTGYAALFEEYFNKYQLPNGLWEECSVEDGTVYYNAINGLMKISGGYNSLGIKLNYAEEAIRAAAFMVTHIGNAKDGSDWQDSKGKKPNGSVDVYNPWVCINNVIKNVRTHDGDDAAEALRENIIKPNALQMIKVTTRKIGMFARVDGSYCYNWGTVGATSQGAPVAVEGTLEGDVNGGNIAFTGTYRNMANALGIKVEPFGHSDLLKFLNRIEELDSVIKDDITVALGAGEFDFDEDVAGSTEPEDVTLSMNTGSVEIVEDNRAGKEGNVLKFTTKNGAGSSVTVKPAGVNGAVGAVLEWEMRFDTITKNESTAFQIKIGDLYMLTLGVTADGVLKVGDASSTGAGISNTFDIKLDALDWNSFRVEFYVLNGEERSTMTKIYINGDLRFASTNYFGKESGMTPGLKYTYARFFALSATDFTCLFDNVKAYQTASPYQSEPIYNPERVKDFETIPEGADMPSGVVTNGGVIEKDGTNSILTLDGSGKDVTVSATVASGAANCYALNTKMKIDAASVGTVGKLYLSKSDKSKAIVAYEIVVYEEGGKSFGKLVEFNRDGEKGAEIKGLPIGEWFELAVEFYPYFYESEESSIIYLNGQEIGRGNLNYYIGTVAGPYGKMILETLSDVKISLDNVIPESIEKVFKSSDGVKVDDPDVALPEMGASTNTAAGAEHDGRFDFEDYELGTPKVPGLRTTVNTDEYENRILIAEDPVDAANKVIKHNVVKSSSGSSSFFTASKKSPAGANCYVYSYDLFIGSYTRGGIQTAIKGKIGDKEVNMYQNNINFSGADGTGTITIKAKRDVEGDFAEGEVKDNSTVAVSKTNIVGWVNIRYELYTDKGVVQIYFDDEFRGETDVVYSGRMGADLYRCSMFTTSDTTALIYYDNIVVEAVNKAYEAKTPVSSSTPAGDGKLPEGSGTPEVTPPSNPDSGEDVTPEEPVISGIYDFDKYQVGTSSVSGLNTTFKDGSMMIVEDPRNAAGRVLEYYTYAGANEILKFTSKKNDNAKTLILSFDMLLGTYETSSLMQIKLDSSYMLSFTAKNDLITVEDYSSTDGKVTDRRIQTLMTGIDATKWHNYKVEYAVIDGMALIKIYLDNELKAVSGNYYDQNGTNGTPAFEYADARFSSMSAAIFSMQLDNVTVIQSETAMVKADYTHFAHLLGAEFSYTPITEVKDFENGVIVDGILTSHAVGDAEHISASIVNDPINTDASTAVGKVLKVSVGKDATCKATESVQTRLTPANLTKATDENGNYTSGHGTYVFSYDVCFGDLPTVTSDTFIEDVIFDHGPDANRESSYWNFMQLILTKNGTFNLKTSNSSGTPNVGVVCKGLILGDGNWHNIRYVVEKAGADSNISVFVDDVCVVYRVNCYYNANDTDANTYINDVYFRQRKNSIDYDVYYDNFLFEYAGEYDVLSGFVK